MLRLLRQRGPNGATCAEVEQALRLPHQTASARIRDSGARRLTPSGRKAIVWVAQERAAA